MRIPLTLFVSGIVTVSVFGSMAPDCIGHEPEFNGHDGSTPLAISADVLYQPTAMPDRILLSWNGDPATTQAVTWRTSTDVSEAVACIAVASDGPSFAENSEAIAATTTLHTSDLGSAHYHTTVFKNLLPETTYAYRVGDQVNWSEWSHFTTASDSPKPFTFIYLGDAQNKIKAHCSRVIRKSYQSAPRAAFMLHAGDLVGWGNSDSNWGEWHAAASHIHRTIPCIATPGNHEYFRRGQDGKRLPEKQLSSHWRPGFAFPLNGPEGLEETVYWTDYQGVRFISLNSNKRPEDQARWLRNVLSNNPNHWTIATLHHPIQSATVDRDNGRLRKLWQPLFDEFQVDLVLQGHDHTYARSKLIHGHTFQENSPSGAEVCTSLGGTVYVISVCGPKMYEAQHQPYMRRTGEGIQLFQIIHVSDSEIRYEARTALGRLHDAFTISRDSEGKNVLVDKIPLPNQLDAKRTVTKQH